MITVTNSLPKLAAIDSNDMSQAIMTDRAPLFLNLYCNHLASLLTKIWLS